ncbi:MULTISPECIES: alpha/beta hydrolase [Staphylococcus]|nr:MULTISPECIES: alpha/beta hydrolase [Staphylococcus]GGG90289.1 alpha/beta hydrolase [Staphylococcus pragensis]
MKHIFKIIGLNLLILIAFSTALLLFYILDMHSWAYMLWGILLVVTCANFYFKWLTGWKSVLGVTGVIALLVILTFVGRVRHDVSFQGNLVAGTLRVLTRDLGNHSQSNNEAQNNSYNWKNWRPPKGYNNEKVSVGKVDGYLLQKNKSTHNNKIVYQIHGGGYVNGFDDMYNKAAVNYSKAAHGAPVFSIDYRVAPKHQYPAALEDAISGYNWLLHHGYHSKDIIVAGDSAGGGLALALTLKLENEGKNLPRMLILSSPWTDLAAQGKSYRENFHKDVIFGSNQAPTKATTDIKVPYASKNELKNPYVSPAYGHYNNMPPMLIQTGKDEMLLSDSKIVAHKVNQDGGHAKLITYAGMFHTFYILTPWLPESHQAWNEIEQFIKENK